MNAQQFRGNRPVVTRALSIAALTITVLATTGCWQGQNAATYQQATQGATGDGVEKDSLDRSVGIRGAVLVSDGNRVAVVVTLVNHSDAPDALTAVEVNGNNGGVLQQPIPIMPGQTTQVGQANSDLHIFGTGIDSAGSRFVPVRFVFRNGGAIEAELLVRAPEGMWADIPLS